VIDRESVKRIPCSFLISGRSASERDSTFPSIAFHFQILMLLLILVYKYSKYQFLAPQEMSTTLSI
jgi:hypothetical protein